MPKLTEIFSIPECTARVVNGLMRTKRLDMVKTDRVTAVEVEDGDKIEVGEDDVNGTEAKDLLEDQRRSLL